MFQRAERERKRQAHIRYAIAAVILLLASGAAIFLYRSQQRGTILIDTAAACGRYLPKDQASPAGPLNALDQCIKTLEAMQKGAASDPRDAEILELIGAGKKDEADAPPIRGGAGRESGRFAEQKSSQALPGDRRHCGCRRTQEGPRVYAEAAKLDPDNITACSGMPIWSEMPAISPRRSTLTMRCLNAGVKGQE